MITLQQRCQEGDAAELAALVTALGATTLIKLMKTGFVPSYLSKAADFAAHEADFDGYAANTVAAWSAVVDDVNDQPTTFSGASLFTMTGNTTPNDLSGVWLETAAGKVVRWYLFDNPISVNTLGDFVSANIGLQEGTGGFVDVLT